MSYYKRNSYRGVNGYALENFIEFLTGERPVTDRLEKVGKTEVLTFYIADRYLSEDEDNMKMLKLLTAFKNRYGIELKKLSDI